MKEYISLFETTAAYNTAKDNLDLPNVAYCKDQNELHYNPIPHNYADDYLTFVALENGTFTFTPKNNNVISYSTDDGDTWTEGNNVNVNSDDKVLWKGTMTPTSSQGIGTFSSTANFDVQGNAMSLLYGDSYKGKTDLTGKNYAFYNLFYNNTKVVNAENLSLSATTLANYCYTAMFSRCTSLVSAPVLPATTLTLSCYGSMFYSCTNLVTAPTKLPATTLANQCYVNMFNSCTSLTTAPELPATALANYCYDNMFNGCTSLNYIKTMFTTTPSTSYTRNWVNGVASTGTFVKNSAAQWNVSGVNGIPSGWTVQTASE